MRYCVAVALTLLIGACASPPPRQAATLAPFVAATDTRAVADATIAELKTVTADEADSGKVCEKVERPGSRMARTVCYTKQERVAYQEARDEAMRDQLDELQREQRWRDEVIRQAEMDQRRPTGFGLGPN